MAAVKDEFLHIRRGIVANLLIAIDVSRETSIAINVMRIAGPFL
ncbi:MAG TPA: hypothetical protein VHY56_07600 [Candidatus Binataceae bacterium]|jgi:hypothetical protein|nr:hypothetical protein [Candidatus Binataceae bacterium]